MLGNDADALDATQDALLAAVRALDRFDGRSAVATWLYRIATNTCIDELRRRRRRPAPGRFHDVAEPARAFDGVSPSGSSHSGGGAAVDGTAGLWQQGPTFRGSSAYGDGTSGVDARIDVDRALATLPVDLRTAVVLRDVCDLPYEEIAEVMAVPIGTVRSRIARGRAALAACLSNDAHDGNRKAGSHVETHVGAQAKDDTTPGPGSKGSPGSQGAPGTGEPGPEGRSSS
jgi:RNA polymerase sigma-70 factor (ECF subfamily)